MNPEIIYTNYRDEALAEQFSAEAYSVFVAMPFADRFSYHPREILEQVIRRALDLANHEKLSDIKTFLPPETALDIPGTANVITEDIVNKILRAHFFIADLTGGNAGVLLEAGIAMAFKPNTQIVLLTQHSLEELHFDIRNNRVLSYSPGGNVDEIKAAFLAAARHLEEDRKKYVTQVSQGLTSDAIRTIHHYAQWYQDEKRATGQPGLFAPSNIPPFFVDQYKEQALVLFQLTMHELHHRKMIWTDYNTSLIEKDGQRGESHTWASHLTRLGWLFVKNEWQNYRSDLCQRIK